MLEAGPHIVNGKIVDCKMAVPKESPSKADVSRKKEATRISAQRQLLKSKDTLTPSQPIYK